MSIESRDTIEDGVGPNNGRASQEADSTSGGTDSGADTSAETSTDKESGFPPPDEPIMVYCLHCGREYKSSEMVPPDGARTPIMMAGFWWCGTPGCNAGGFGLDIFPTDPEWKDPKGLLHIIADSDDEEEFEWDEDDEE
jgi:hypothetical protein